jgi:hypothetical protein
VQKLSREEFDLWLREANLVFIEHRHTPPEVRPLYVERLYLKAYNETARRGQQLVLFTS